jgi:hypothetical protein
VTLTARDRLCWLLRTYADAHEEFNPGPPSADGGTSTLPADWRYYRELDRLLPEMPTYLRRALRQRYIHPHRQANLERWTARVTVLKDGRVRGLPANSELANPNHGYHSTKRSLTPKGPFTGHVSIAKWHPQTRTRDVDQGLTWLLEHMYGGRTDRICLPAHIADAAPTPTQPKPTPATPHAVTHWQTSASTATLPDNQRVQYALRPPTQAVSRVQGETR